MIGYRSSALAESVTDRSMLMDMDKSVYPCSSPLGMPLGTLHVSHQWEFHGRVLHPGECHNTKCPCGPAFLATVVLVYDEVWCH